MTRLSHLSCRFCRAVRSGLKSLTHLTWNGAIGHERNALSAVFAAAASRRVRISTCRRPGPRFSGLGSAATFSRRNWTPVRLAAQGGRLSMLATAPTAPEAYWMRRWRRRTTFWCGHRARPHNERGYVTLDRVAPYQNMYFAESCNTRMAAAVVTIPKVVGLFGFVAGVV